MRSKQVALPSANFRRTRLSGAHERPPGVNTCLSVRGHRVYGQSLIVDRGLRLVLQARPTHTRLTRFMCVTPYFRGILPQQDDCLPKHRHRYPVVIPLHRDRSLRSLPPSARVYASLRLASTWLGLRLAKHCK